MTVAQKGWPAVQRRWPLLPSVLAAVGLAACGGAFWLQVGADFFGRRAPFWVSEDFTAFYSAGQLVAHGAGRLLYHPAVVGAAERAAAGHPVGGSGVLAYFNPPFFALLFLPLSRFSLGQAFQIWTLFNLTLVGVNAWLLWQIALPLERRWRLVLIIGFFALYPVTYSLRVGQFSLLLAAGAGAAYLFLLHRQERAAGLALALLLIKPELLLPIMLFLAWKRRWHVFETLVPAIIVAAVASIAMIGWQSAISYPSYLLHSTVWRGNGVGAALMFGWNGLLALTWRQGPRPFEALIAGVLSLAGLALAAYAWRGRLRFASARFSGQWLLLIGATLLADPHLYLQDTVVVAPAVAAFLARSHASRRRTAVGLVMGWLVLLAYGIIVYEIGGARGP